MRKLMALLMLMLVLIFGVVNAYSISNATNIASATLRADDPKSTVDTAPNAYNDILDISVNKGME